MQHDTLHSLYVDGLRELHRAEQQQLPVLSNIADSTSDTAFGRILRIHIRETVAQIARIEQLCGDLRTSPREGTNRGMEVLLHDLEEIMHQDTANDARIARIIACMRAVKHLEIAGYGTARSYAATFGLADHEVLLQQSFNEESRTDYALCGITANTIRLDTAEVMSDRSHLQQTRMAATANSSDGHTKSGLY